MRSVGPQRCLWLVSCLNHFLFPAGSDSADSTTDGWDGRVAWQQAAEQQEGGTELRRKTRERRGKKRWRRRKMRRRRRKLKNLNQVVRKEGEEDGWQEVWGQESSSAIERLDFLQTIRNISKIFILILTWRQWSLVWTVSSLQINTQSITDQSNWPASLPHTRRREGVLAIIHEFHFCF